MSFFFVALSLLCMGCPSPLPEVKPAQYASPEHAREWTPPAEERASVEEAVRKQGEPAALPSKARLSLAELIDVALRQSPVTQRAWAQALASAANWGRARSSYYPWVDGLAEGAVGKISLVQGGNSYADVGVGLQYLLLDFGTRGAQSEAARQALLAADWNHNQAIQDVLRNVPQAYYALIGSKAQVGAAEKSLAEARTSLAATRMRKASGVSTLADVLQAQAAEAQMRVDLAGSRGAVEIARGNLATTVGWMANQSYDVADEPANFPLAAMGRSVDALIAAAQRNRPDLHAALAQMRQKEAELKEARAMPFPKLTGGGKVQWETTKDDNRALYYGGLQVQIPIFHGFDMENAVRAARAELKAAEQELRQKQESVVSEVWNASQQFATAKEQVQANRALLASAEESYQVSLERYKAGAAEIVELMNAQSLLAGARSQLINARMSLYTSYAELLHAVGTELSLLSPVQEQTENAKRAGETTDDAR